MYQGHARNAKVVAGDRERAWIRWLWWHERRIAANVDAQGPDERRRSLAGPELSRFGSKSPMRKCSDLRGRGGRRPSRGTSMPAASLKNYGTSIRWTSHHQAARERTRAASAQGGAPRATPVRRVTSTMQVNEEPVAATVKMINGRVTHHVDAIGARASISVALSMKWPRPCALDGADIVGSGCRLQCALLRRAGTASAVSSRPPPKTIDDDIFGGREGRRAEAVRAEAVERLWS